MNPVKIAPNDPLRDMNKSMVSNEEFSSLGQSMLGLIPILGPLIGIMYGHRGAQHIKTSCNHSRVDRHGYKSGRVTDTGIFDLRNLNDAKDYVHLVEDAVKNCMNQIKDVDRIDMGLWPQKDGIYGSLQLRSNKHGEFEVFTQNNPGKLKWFTFSLAGKRVIRLKDYDIEKFKFTGRTISCPFKGEEVEFDVSQLRSFKFQTRSNEEGGFEVWEYNFDA